MAPLTQIGSFGYQELIVGGAVRGVAGCTIFHGGRMFPQEGSSFFGMTFIAFLIEGIGRDEFIGDGSMGIVAVRTRHLPLSDGVMG
jgi:hypothetical protein